MSPPDTPPAAQCLGALLGHLVPMRGSWTQALPGMRRTQGEVLPVVTHTLLVWHPGMAAGTFSPTPQWGAWVGTPATAPFK